MAKIFRTNEPLPSGATELLHIYNGLDCCITHEVWSALRPQLDEVTRRTYEFSLSLQGPVFDMTCRGVLIDQSARAQVLVGLRAKAATLRADFSRICLEGIGEDFSPTSPVQLKRLFYEVLGLPPQKHKGQVTTNEDALERLRRYMFAEPLCNYILELRKINKKIQELETAVDPDGRMRTSYNIAGTSTGRFSSYASAFDTGTNMQNRAEEMRRPFIADPGKKFAYIDGQQIQSRIVGAICWNYFHDGAYLDACESGDLHTIVCRLVWDYLGWTGDPRADKAIAKQEYHGGRSYRDVAKALGHGTNFFGKPPNMAKETGIPVSLVTPFRQRYLSAFPCVEQRFEYTRQLLIKQGHITTMTGRRRWFFGRRWEDDTLKDALAYEPQEVESFITNTGMLRIFRELPEVEVMVQLHDALLIQYPEEREEELVPHAMDLMTVPVRLVHGRDLVVPLEAQVGWNWMHATPDNPDGLVGWNGNDNRKRSKEAPFMDRVL